MKKDIILAGVGGQGILSMAYVIDEAAVESGFNIKQAEIHGMAQRGGAVYSHLRISSSPIASDLIPKGSADLIISIEPIEGLRYLSYLAPDGILITNSSPVRNIPNYPDMEKVMGDILSLKKHIIIDAESLARRAGSFRAQNMVMLGASSAYLSLDRELLKKYIGELFSPRGEKIVELNLSAFAFGERIGRFYTLLLEEGVPPLSAFLLSSKIEAGEALTESVDLWGKLLSSQAEEFVPILKEFSGEISPRAEVPKKLLGLSLAVSYTHLTLPTKRIV